MLWCSGCTWREGRVGNAVDSGRVDIIVDDKGMLPVHVLCDCHVVVWVSRLPLPLPLPDRVVVVVTAVFQLSLPLADRVQVALGGKDVMVTNMLIMDVSRLLIMLKDCCWSTFCCCAVACVSRLSLSLSDRVPVVKVALGGKDVLAMILIADMLTLLMLIMDC